MILTWPVFVSVFLALFVVTELRMLKILEVFKALTVTLLLLVFVVITVSRASKVLMVLMALLVPQALDFLMMPKVLIVPVVW